MTQKDLTSLPPHALVRATYYDDSGMEVESDRFLQFMLLGFPDHQIANRRNRRLNPTSLLFRLKYSINGWTVRYTRIA
jgi:hypothetical protein